MYCAIHNSYVNRTDFNYHVCSAKCYAYGHLFDEHELPSSICQDDGDELYGFQIKCNKLTGNPYKTPIMSWGSAEAMS